MNVLQRLTIRHLKMNKKRTIITIIGIALSVAMVTAISSLVVSFQDLLYRDSVAQYGLWHVRFYDLDEEDMEKIINDPLFSQWEIVEDPELSDKPILSLQFTKLHKNVLYETEALFSAYDIDQNQSSLIFNNNLLIAKGIVPAAYYSALYTFAGILLLLVAISSVLVIANAFTISTNERTQQFGLLKSTGATKKQVQVMVLFEGAALCLMAIPIGLIIGLFAAGCALTIANYAFTQIAAIRFAVSFRLVLSPLAMVVTVAAAIITVFLSAWFPARKAQNISPVDAIRQNTAVKLSKKTVRINPLTKKLFGFEGLLAAKTMKRNRSRFRTAIISLVVSIVLFIGVSSFGLTLIKATNMVYEDIGSNGSLYFIGEDRAFNNALYDEIKDWQEADVSYERRIAGSYDLTKDQMTPFYINKYGENLEKSLYIHTMDLTSMTLLADQYGADYLVKTLGNDAIPQALLINTTGTIIERGRRMSFQPFQLPAGTLLEPLFTDMPLEISGEIDVIPPGIHPYFSGRGLNLIVSEDVFYKLREEDPSSDSLILSVNPPDITAFEEKLLDYLSVNMKYGYYDWRNYETAMTNNRNFAYLVLTFVYGFIVMLSLIAITSVIATISTSVTLRKGELAMLRSVGMTEDAMNKMLNYENLLYGLKALAFGIPQGLMASIAMHLAIQTVMDFEYILPASSIFMAIIAVFLLTFATQKYAKKKVNKATIVESLRGGYI